MWHGAISFLTAFTDRQFYPHTTQWNGAFVRSMGEHFEESPYLFLEFNYDSSVVHHKDRNFEISNIPCSCEHFLFIFVISLMKALFIHLVACLTTGPKPLQKRAFQIVRFRASSFKWEYPLLSLRSSNSFLRLLLYIPVTSFPPCIFPSITRCRRQFLHKTWLI
jgi:hypothetical protein